MPKHRSTLFTVLRTQKLDPEFHDDGTEWVSPTLIGSFYSLEGAEQQSGKYQQEMKEKGFDGFFKFEVQSVTYYDS